MNTKSASSRLLINENPLQVLPSLAVAIGLNEAIFIQQIHYWLQTSKHEHDGRLWIFNTLEEWQLQFPFWSVSTLRRTIDNLRKRGLLLTSNYNQTAAVRTLWYSIDYDLLNTLASVDSNSPFAHSEQMENIRMDSPSVQNEQMLIGTETTTETTQENDVTPPPGEHLFAAESPKEAIRLLKSIGFTENQAQTAAARRSDIPNEFPRIKQWLETSKARKPVAVLWDYMKQGKLPDDLPPVKPVNPRDLFRRADGSTDYDAYSAYIAKNPWLYQGSGTR